MKVVKVEDLAASLNLVKFHTYELIATARDEYESEKRDSGDADSSDEQIDPSEGQVGVQTGIRRRPRALDYRVEFLLNHASGRILADMGAFYDCDPSLDLDEVPPEVVIEFGDRVALMALYPYLRQAMSDLGQRVGVTVALPMLRRGDLSFGPVAGDDEPDS
ncbi:hypothetical protein [Myceligenerans cantabricum]